MIGVITPKRGLRGTLILWKKFNFLNISTGGSATPAFGSQSENSKPQTGFSFSMGGTPSFGSKTETQSAANKTEQALPKSSSESEFCLKSYFVKDVNVKINVYFVTLVYLAIFKMFLSVANLKISVNWNKC